MGEGKRMSTGALVALTAVSAGMSIIQGVQQNSASTEAGIAYMQQAQIARTENELAIQQKQREVDKVAARQVMAMAKNGMDTGRGTPLQILQETAFLGQQEIDALKLQGNALVGYYSALGEQQFNNGRAALLGGASDALATVVGTGINAKTAGLGGSSTSTKNTMNTIQNTQRTWGRGSYKTGIEYGYTGGLSGLS